MRTRKPMSEISTVQKVNIGDDWRSTINDMSEFPNIAHPSSYPYIIGSSLFQGYKKFVHTCFVQARAER